MNNMQKLISAEYQKLTRTFTKKLIWFAPIVTLFLSGILGAGTTFQSGGYNWWYVMLLPGMLTLICAGVVQNDQKKLKYRGILSLPINPGKIWVGKIGVCTLLYLISCIVFFICVTLGGFARGTSIPLIQSAAASVLLFITFLWQIPWCMFLTERLGMFATVIINVVGSEAFCVIAAKLSIGWMWWIPYAIPAHIMCPVIKVLPNGLPVPANDPLLSTSIILPGVVINLILFFVLLMLTALPYRNLEAK